MLKFSEIFEFSKEKFRKIPILKEFEWFEWFEWFGPSPTEPFNSGGGRGESGSWGFGMRPNLVGELLAPLGEAGAWWPWISGRTSGLSARAAAFPSRFPGCCRPGGGVTAAGAGAHGTCLWG